MCGAERWRATAPLPPDAAFSATRRKQIARVRNFPACLCHLPEAAVSPFRYSRAASVVKHQSIAARQRSERRAYNGEFRAGSYQASPQIPTQVSFGRPAGKATKTMDHVTFKGSASLNGHLFNFTNSPNRYGPGPFYELHVWAWKANPRGAFADMNPDVTCKHAHWAVFSPLEPSFTILHELRSR
jgi:hypothetical protein